MPTAPNLNEEAQKIKRVGSAVFLWIMGNLLLFLLECFKHWELCGRIKWLFSMGSWTMDERTGFIVLQIGLFLICLFVDWKWEQIKRVFR